MSTKRAAKLDQLNRTFGAGTVSEEERRALVTALFDKIAPRYDLMNDLMSFGLHRLWKRRIVRQVASQAAAREGTIVDLAGGTGDIALGVKKALPGREIIIVDASAGMLDVARRRSGGGLALVHASGEDIPLPDCSAAAVSLVFGLRNMTSPALALSQCARILKPGGRLHLLEFSQASPWFRPFYALHARFVIPALGALIARDRRAYSYLVQSIALFPGKEDISRELQEAGFTMVSVQPFMFGVAAYHCAEKR